MPFSTSTLPLEANPDYIKSERFSYAEFTTWFNEVKTRIDSADNLTNLKSDRLEAIFDQYGTFLSLTLCPSGFNLSSVPQIRARMESQFDSTAVSYEVPEAAEGESLVEVTRRWVLAMHSDLESRIRSMRMRLRWFDFAYEDTIPDEVSPPPLMP